MTKAIDAGLPANLKSEYDKLSADRAPYLERARESAIYTIPALLPPSGKTSSRKLRTSFSNFGARCVNSLAAKLLLALLPARSAFFRLSMDDETAAAIAGDEKQASLVDAALGRYEQRVLQEIEANQVRTPVGEAIKHLLVAGNVLARVLDTGSIRLYPLHSFVCQRDGDGNLLSTISHEEVSPAMLEPKVAAAVNAKLGRTPADAMRNVNLYTGVFRRETDWFVWQEVEGIRVPGSDGTYPLDANPWMALRWTPVDGESYGRGQVEDYQGYFQSLEALTATLVKGSAVSGKVIFMVRPNGMVKKAALARASNGDVIDGAEEDVKTLGVDKHADFSTVREMLKDIKEELSFAFALNQSIQRNAERVTAEEIRYMAQELDALLGGIYSTLAVEFQVPFLRRLISMMERAKKLPMMPKGTLRPVIVTGLDALGRGAELDNLRALVKDIVDLGGIETASTWINFDELFRRLATARSVKTAGLIKSLGEVNAAMQSQNESKVMETLGPNAINAAGAIAKQQLTTQGAPA